MKKALAVILSFILMLPAPFGLWQTAAAEPETATAATSDSAAGTVISYTDGRQFQNPVANGADPFVFKDTDGTYYMYTTNAGSNGYLAYRSTDLVNWYNQGYVMMATDVSLTGVDECTNFWAPEVFLYQGTYYLVMTTNEHLAIAVSDSPTGPFKTPAGAGYLFPNYKNIDGHFFLDDDGQVYFYYVKTAQDSTLGVWGNVIWGCRFDMTTLKPVAGTETRLLGRLTSGWEKYDGSCVAEGPEVFKRNGTYYLTYTCNGYTSAYYAVGVAKASSPLGNFASGRQSNNPVLRGGGTSIVGTGHCCYTTSPDGTELWMVYHKHAGKTQVENREICLDKVTFDANGNVVVSAAHTAGKPTAGLQAYPSGSECSVKPVALDGKFAALSTLPTVYVHMNDGKDTNAGTQSSPYRSLEKAYAALTPNGGTIVLLSSHDISQAKKENDTYMSPESQIAQTGNYFSTPTGITGPILLRGINPGIRFRFSFLTFNSDHYIDNLMLRPNSTSAVIECGFHTVTFGENLSVNPAYGSGEERFPFILGGYYQCGLGTGSSDAYMQSSPYVYWLQGTRDYNYVSTSTDYTISVYGGTWRSIIGGSWRVRADASVGLINANVTLNLGGNVVVQPVMSNSSDANYFVSVTGYSAHASGKTATLCVTGGTYYCPLYMAGRIGGVSTVSGVTHTSVRHAGKLVADISGGTFYSCTLGGKLYAGGVSATQDNANNVTGSYTLNVHEGVTMADANTAFVIANGSKTVSGTKTAHVTCDTYRYAQGQGFGTVDYKGHTVPFTVYVDAATGSDNNVGTTAQTALKTLKAAYTRLSAVGGTLLLCSDVVGYTDSYFEAPACDGIVTVRGQTGTEKLSIRYLSLSSATVFDHLILYADQTSSSALTLIECRFHDLYVTDSVVCQTAAAGNYPMLIAGHYQTGTSTTAPDSYFNTSVKTRAEVSMAQELEQSVDVYGGTWRSLKGGNTRKVGAAHVGSVDGCIRMTVGGNAVISPVTASNDANYRVAATGSNASDGGRFFLTVTGGTIGSPLYGVARMGAVNAGLAAENTGMKATVEIAILGGTLTAYAQGKSYATPPTVRGAQNTDAGTSTTPSLDGTFTLRIGSGVTLPADTVLDGTCGGRAYIVAPVAVFMASSGFDCPYYTDDTGRTIDASQTEHELETTCTATCTQNGKKITTCRHCDYYAEEAVKATGHSYGEWVTVKEPTGTEPGVAKRTCGKCGGTERKTLDPITVRVRLSDESTVSGGTVRVTVSLENDPGLCAMRFLLSYDRSAMTLTDVTYTDLLGGSVIPDTGNDPFALVWCNGLLDETATGIAAILTFRVSDDYSGRTSLSLICEDTDDTLDTEYHGYRVTGDGGCVTVTLREAGDLDANGSIDNADMTLLLRALSGWTVPDTVTTAVADLDGNGRVNNRDAIRLVRIIAKWYE